MNVAAARGRFDELLRLKGAVDPAELDTIWTALPRVRAEEILGEWKGSEFATGHPLCGQLNKIRWYGKSFLSLLDAKPLICRREDGTLYSNTTTMKGEASLWNVEFRGEVTATMVYDSMPVFDHFKRIDEHTLFGIMNGKNVTPGGQHFYFALSRVG
ncbi:DUF4334 domain-containing protein [Hoyosella sp. YIM 151337]|uniref:DUF4334 domain-containing protein n=1 Tax=Hoyosella sp. YIM 151337 TaxID=2992742 RepID=UPI0022363003|nr:DUF4334 domain-containing protein [Hoyosella sp. YIM 151337]MCW4353704.1 DUF4334 domain-containing protein [Hoyosella sp. YIM 151337]